MGDMGSLRGRLQGDFRSNYAVSDLESYLDAMLVQATHFGFRLDGEKRALGLAHEDRHSRHTLSGTNSTSGGEAPDSAIDMDGPPSPYGGQGHNNMHVHYGHVHGYGHASTVGAALAAAAAGSRSSSGGGRSDLPLVEIEEFLDELTELPDDEHNHHHRYSPAPTPPPKASRRASIKQQQPPPLPPPRAPDPVTTLPLDAALHPPPTANLSPFTAGALPGLGRPESTRSVSEYSAMLIDSEGHAVVPRRVSSLRSLPKSPSPGPGFDDAGGGGGGGDAPRSTVGSLRAISPPAVINEVDDYNPYGMVSASGGYTTTTILGGAAALEHDPYYAYPAEGGGVDDGSALPPPPIKDRRLSSSLSSRLLGRKKSLNTPAQPTRPSSSLGVTRKNSSHNGGSQFLHSLNVPSVSSSSFSRPLSPSRASSVRSDMRPVSSLGSITTTTTTHRGTHVLNALAGPSELEEEEEEEEEAEEENGMRTPSPSDFPTPTPFVTNISAIGPNDSGGGNGSYAAATMGRKHSVETTSSSSRGLPRPSTAVTSSNGGGASIRSNSSRISSMFRRVSLWRPRTGDSSIAARVVEEDTEPDDIFGVSLKKTLQMAATTVKTHHDGSKASSRRQFPRCVLTCVNFIRDQHGVRAPNIFGGDMGMPLSGSGGPGMLRVAALKEKFSTAPLYGEGLDWTGHDVYDAAELLVLFLQQLPKPLITETVAKRWIVMSKQATLPGSMGLRLDACIDFWDEALLGVRGAARDLFKLLLNLWGDIADAADANDMTAERLAARLLNPLMHLPAGKYTTDYMLGLAFLIRKRSEYSAVLRGGRKSKAAF